MFGNVKQNICVLGKCEKRDRFSRVMSNMVKICLMMSYMVYKFLGNMKHGLDVQG